MKRKIGLVIVAAGSVSILSGCVQMAYTKSVAVHKNPAGEVTEIVETETISEPHSEMKHFKDAPDTIPFENLK